MVHAVLLSLSRHHPADFVLFIRTSPRQSFALMHFPLVVSMAYGTIALNRNLSRRTGILDPWPNVCGVLSRQFLSLIHATRGPIANN